MTVQLPSAEQHLEGQQFMQSMAEAVKRNGRAAMQSRNGSEVATEEIQTAKISEPAKIRLVQLPFSMGGEVKFTANRSCT